MTGRFSDEKHKAFEAELHALVQKYLDMPDVDALTISFPLERACKQAQFIGIDERRSFAAKAKQKK
jgi:hypothetical protein